MAEIKFDIGVQEIPVNGGRTVKINPSDDGFAEMIFDLLGKLDAQIKTCDKKLDGAGDNAAKRFEHKRNLDNNMRASVDAVFGEGFCADVFGTVRLTAQASGLTVIENFLFAVLDVVNEDVKANLAQRNSRIAYYTEKYRKAKS